MHRWKFSALASAACLCAALSSTDAAALALGPLSVQSPLGSPLRAEIDIPQITEAELGTLLATIATPEVFRAHGMEYSPAARSIQVELQRLPNGRAKLRLSTTGPVNDPFVDLVLDASWNTGSLVRSYTMLLDPEPTRSPAPAAATAPQVTTPAQVGRSYRSDSPPATAPARSSQRARATYPAASSSPTAPASASGKTLTVKSGDTAGRLLAPHTRAGASLDQMLVALLRANPSAFMAGNVNRLKAGAVLTLPTPEEAQTTPAAEARRIIAAQSQDFNAYRRSLARKAPEATVAAAQRSDAGRVQAQVEDASPSATPMDRLTLTKQAMPEQAQAALAEEQVAQARQSAAQEDRLQELQRNLAELRNLGSDSASPAAVTAAGDSSSGPATPETPPATDTAPLSLDIAAQPAPAVEAEATPAEAAPPPPPPAPEPKPTAAPKPKVVAPPPPPEPTLMEQVLGNPLLPAAGGGIVALLLGLLLWRKRKAKQATAAEPTAAPLGSSELGPDSLFDSSGGQQIDTSDADLGGMSTMAYSPSQLDASGDVDPIAEADVYLAYGKDEEAQKILKEALRITPQRLPLHVKLAEIHAKHHELPQLEAVARTVQQISQGQGPDWEQVRTLGRNMDPDNPLYAPAGDAPPPSSPSGFAQALASSATAAASTPELPADLPDLELPVSPESTSDALDIDHEALLASALASDLDLNAPPAEEVLPTHIQDTTFADTQQATVSELGLDFDNLNTQLGDTGDSPATEPVLELPEVEEVIAPAEEASSEAPDMDALDFSLDDLLAPADTVEQPAQEAAAAAAPTAAEDDFGLSQLDLGDLDALGNTDTQESASTPDDSQDGGLSSTLDSNLDLLGESEASDSGSDEALATKLDLAQEFASIGDTEGARSLVEEVLADASGTLKTRAQKMLNDLT